MHAAQHKSSQKATNPTLPNNTTAPCPPPAELRGIKGWLLWKVEQHSGEKKPRKIPFYASGVKRHGRQGGEQDRARLVTYSAAVDATAAGGYSGLAFAPLPGFNVVALDFDNCVTDGHVAAEVQAVIAGTYAEFSPSGKGVRALFRGDVGNHKKISKDGSIGFETFSTTGFVTITGNVLPGVEMAGLEDTVADITPDVLAYCEKRFGHDTRAEIANADDSLANFKPKLGLTITQIEEQLAQLDPDMDRDGWIRVGMGLHHETEGDDTGFAIWNDWSANGGKYPSEESLREQWDSFDRARNTGRTVSMATVKRMFKEATTPKPGAATAEELAAVLANTPAGPREGCVGTPADFTGKFPAVPAAVLSRQPPPEWLIKGVVPKADVALVFGASGSGKSFIVLDIGAAIARGVPWRGHKTIKGRVLVVAAEGAGGFGKRLKAYAQHHQISIDELEIAVIDAAPNFLVKDDISEVVRTVKAAGGFDLIIIDTLAQVTPGANENAGEDMGLALSNAKALSGVTGALVLLIHHAGKDATRGARGWSGIKAAADAEIEIIKHDSGAREMRISKMKDGEDGLRFPFDLKVIELGVDGDGEKITSCVIEHTDRRSVSVSTIAVPKGENQKHVYNAAIANGANSEAGANVSTVIDNAIKFLPHDPTAKKRDQRRNHVIRALTTLSDRDVLVVRHNQVYTPYFAPLASEEGRD